MSTTPTVPRIATPSLAPAVSAPSLDDMFQSPADSTAQGVPDWISSAVGQPQTNVLKAPEITMGNGQPASAFVRAGDTHNINVQDSGYSPTMAAHESTHLFQNSRNQAFQDNLRSQLPNGTMNAGAYDYGGIPAISTSHKGIGDYNAEQQAAMVGDLTNAQDSLPMKPNLQQLAQWDQTKRALERPIQQLQAIPAAETGLSGKVDAYAHAHGMGTPVDSLKTFLGFGGIHAPIANPTPSAPSVALGYANPSKLVR